MSLMNDLAKVVGTSALSTLGPIGGVLAAVLNNYLGDDQKVTESTPFPEVHEKFKSLSPEKQADVLMAMQQADVTKHTSDNEYKEHRIDAIEATDRMGKSYRPQIALLMAVTVAVISVSGICIVGMVSYKNNTMPSWELISALLFLPIWVVQRYFHAEVQDGLIKASQSMGQKIDMPMGGASQVVSTIFNRKKGV